MRGSERAAQRGNKGLTDAAGRARARGQVTATLPTLDLAAQLWEDPGPAAAMHQVLKPYERSASREAALRKQQSARRGTDRAAWAPRMPSPVSAVVPTRGAVDKSSAAGEGGNVKAVGRAGRRHDAGTARGGRMPCPAWTPSPTAAQCAKAARRHPDPRTRDPERVSQAPRLRDRQ